MNVVWIVALTVYLSVALATLVGALADKEDTEGSGVKSLLVVILLWPLGLVALAGLWVWVVVRERWGAK